MVNVEWSVSQSYQYNACPKSWFVQHGSADKHEILTRSVPLRSVTGIAVHKAISSQINNWRNHRDVSEVAAENVGMTCLSRIFAQKEKTITESVNGMALEEDVLSRMENAIHLRVATFFRMFWPHLSKHQYMTHEELDSFLIDGARMWVQVDLATRDTSGNLLVSDWKTGQSHNDEADSHQMEVYALWANKRFEPNPARIQTQVVNLRTGHVYRESVDPQELRRVERELAKEIAGLSEALKVGVFPAVPLSGKCISCNSLRFCSEGRSTIQGLDSQRVDMD